LATKSEVLRSVPLFQGMTDRAIEAIGYLALNTTFARGAVITQEGAPGDSFIVIVTGRANVDVGGRQVRELSAGEYLGEISLIDGGPRTATVTAVEPIEALVITRTGFEQLMGDFPAVRLDVLTALTQRIRERTPALSD
jgi:CRP/FNR family transcriptional regulator, cyclic AMP receptor protein